MVESLGDYIRTIDLVKKNINAVKSSQLRSVKIKNEIRSLVEEYFNSIRPTIIGNDENAPDIQIIDANFQELYMLCHKNGSINSYKQKIDQNRKKIVILESKIVSAKPVQPSTLNNHTTDIEIIETLERILPSAAFSYKQAIIDLQSEARFSWRGPATDLRESLRETLDHLAPDNEVESMPGYKPVKDATGPTMKQKVRFILTKRGISKSLSETTENATEVVENGVGTFVRSIYTRSSISTHTPTEKAEVNTIRNYVRVVLCELLEIQN